MPSKSTQTDIKKMTKKQLKVLEDGRLKRMRKIADNKRVLIIHNPTVVSFD